LTPAKGLEGDTVGVVEWVVGAGRRGEVVIDVVRNNGVGVAVCDVVIAGIDDVVGVVAGDGVVSNPGICVVNEVISVVVVGGKTIFVVGTINGVVTGEVTDVAKPVVVISLVVSVEGLLSIVAAATVVGIVVAPLKLIVVGPVVPVENVPVKTGTRVLTVADAVATTPEAKGMTPTGTDTLKVDVAATITDPVAIEELPLALIEARLEALEAQLETEIEAFCPFLHVLHSSTGF